MKTSFGQILSAIVAIILGVSNDSFLSAARGEAALTSWQVTSSTQLAKVREYVGGVLETTWPQTQLSPTPKGGQATPTQSDIQQVLTTPNDVILYSNDLASHTMGPWYAPYPSIYGSWPSANTLTFKFPRNPTTSTLHTASGGDVALLVNGVLCYSYNDAASYKTSTNQDVDDTGDKIWTRLAAAVEYITFDPAQCHQPGNGQYHAHSNPIGLRYQLNDNVTLTPGNATTSDTYTENGSNLHHSPILGWAYDGYPIYGPYGYANAANTSSSIQRMVSGYVIRNGANGTTNLPLTGRHSLPQWALDAKGRVSNLNVSEYGPNLGPQFPLGRYAEDYDHLADHGITTGYDLDRYNGRYCKTPEFPNGTYAYFIAITAAGAIQFPNMIGGQNYGIVSGGRLQGAVPNGASVYYTAINANIQDGTAGELNFTANPTKGSTDQALGKFAVMVNSVGNVSHTTFTVTLGSATGISNLKLYRTNTPTYTNPVQFGVTAVSPSGTTTFGDNYTTTAATYYWLRGDVASGAGGALDARLTSASIIGANVTSFGNNDALANSTIFFSPTYTWNVNGSGDYTVSTNWTPTRSSVTSSDILKIDGSQTAAGVTLTNVPTQTIQSLQVVNGANATISTNGSQTLSTVLTVGVGATLTLDTPTILALSGSSTINGALQINGQLNAGTTTVSGSGTLSLNAGGTLESASISGVGQIVTTTQNFDGAANFLFDGASAQVTGTNFSPFLNNLTINNSAGVTLSGSVMVENQLSVLAGTLNTGAHELDLGGTASVASALVVSSGGTLNCYSTDVTGGGSVTIQSGGTLATFDGNGISASLASGAIQTTTRSFSTGASYQFNSVDPQATGDGLPSIVNNLTIGGSSTKTLTSSVTVNGAFTLAGGEFQVGTNILTLNGSAAVDEFGVVAIPTGGRLNTNNAQIIGGSSTAVTVASGGTLETRNVNGFAASGSSGAIQTQVRDIDQGASVIYDGSVAQFTGSGLPGQISSLETSNTLGVTLSNDTEVLALSVPAGVCYTSGTMSINGSANVNGTLNVPSGTALYTHDTQVLGSGNVFVSSGATLETSDLSGIASSGASGAIQTTSRTFSSGANYRFDGAGQNTGNGLPSSINNLLISGSVTLGADTTVNGQLSLSATSDLYSSTHAITLTSNTTVDEFTAFVIQNNGRLNLGTHQVYGGLGSGLAIQSGGTLETKDANGIVTGPTASGAIQVDQRTFENGSSYVFDGTASQVTGNAMPNTISNLTISNSFGVTLSGDETIAGALTVADFGSFSSGAHILTLSNNSSLGNMSTMGVSNGGRLNTGLSTVSGTGSSSVFVLDSNATLETKNANGVTASGNTGAVQNCLRSLNSGASYIYDGTGAQSTGSGVTTAQVLTIDNPTTVTMSQATTATAQLVLNQGVLDTGNNSLVVNTDGNTAVTRNNGAYVKGSLTRYFDSSIDAFRRFPIGTSVYAGVEITQSGASGTGYITIGTTDGDAPGVSNSAGTLNRYWTVSGNGVDPYGIELQLNYQDTDVSGVLNENSMVMGRYANGFWTEQSASYRDVASNVIMKGSIAGAGIWTAGNPGTIAGSAGSGPGGVDSITGDGNLRLWLRGDKYVTESGGTVALWGDVSGYSNNASAAEGSVTVAGSANFNSRNVLTFPSSGQNYLAVPDAASLDITSGFSAFCAVRRSDDVTCGIFSKRLNCGVAANYGLFVNQISGAPQFEFTYNGGFEASLGITPVAVNDPTIFGSSFNSVNFGVQHFRNGALNGSSTLAGNMSGDGNPIEIGRNGGCTGDGMHGDIAEVVLYAKAVNAAESALVQNYLSSKYSLPLNTAGGAVDMYAGDTGGNGDYDNDVAGIARVSGTTSTLGNSGGLIISDSGFLQNDGDSVLAGWNNNASLSMSNLPYSVGDRLTRFWYIDKQSTGTHSGSPNVTLTFDMSDMGIATCPTATYYLLYRAGNSGTFTNLGITGSRTGDRITFSGIDATTTTLASGYYTLGTSSRDFDGDGYEDNVEARYGSDPANSSAHPPSAFPYNSTADTDGDGYKDFYDYGQGYDPSNAASHPPLGDVNDDSSVNGADAIILKRIAVGTFSLSAFDSSNMDLNRDGVVNGADAIILQRYVVHTVTAIPTN